MSCAAIKSLSASSLGVLQLGCKSPLLARPQMQVGQYALGGEYAPPYENSRSIQTQQAIIASDSDPLTGDELTWSSWIRIDQSQLGVSRLYWTRNHYIDYNKSDGHIYCQFWTTAGIHQMKQAVSEEAWLHICCVWSVATPSKTDLYINGTGGATVTIDYSGTSLVSNLLGMTISESSGANEFTGNFDDIAVFLDSMTVAEVSELYNNGSPFDLADHSAASALRHWWRMGDAFGRFATRETSEFPASPLRDSVSGNNLTGLGPVFNTNTP